MNARNWTLTRTQRRLHTRAGLILMPPPRHVHTKHLMQIHCLTYKHTTGLDALERVAKLHVSGSFCSTFVISIAEGLFGGNTDDYGVTLCDTRVLRVTRS